MAHLRASFATTGDYMRDLDDEDEMPNFWNHGLELTRPARHMKLWFTLQALGLSTISRMINHSFELAELAETALRERAGWEIVFPATLAILNFRYRPQGLEEEDIEKLNEEISRRMLVTNTAVIVTTRLKATVCLRMCTINPTTTEKDIREVVDMLDNFARLISTGPQSQNWEVEF
jgi:glutamate/tyrosine decarboxylase-like PLP-dependent enzyme